MDEKQLLEMSGIGAEDWERTPASVRQLVVQLGLKIEQLEQHLKELQAAILILRFHDIKTLAPRGVKILNESLDR